eukprot:Blabericola_migrator_1__6361@NODE_3208_length_1948_cov_111_755981_g2008_i0_p2_GENE_NODE_3208_length_1948_cov_111_755981_g2008_i0NODE_3208_length_1948_cov_111_755981_g2008_i0_p2_ORF_typecomplete_len102_score7_68_NODE_3208_length_1948_cov_111_755981_g2008_i0312617
MPLEYRYHYSTHFQHAITSVMLSHMASHLEAWHTYWSLPNADLEKSQVHTGMTHDVLSFSNADFKSIQNHKLRSLTSSFLSYFIYLLEVHVESPSATTAPN